MTDRESGAGAYETVIGLEVHVQLATRTKMFCADPAEYGAPPNTRVCPVCLALPGALPTVNARAVELAVMAAHALGCTVHETSVFARKNYFYPDLPKGYQITQYDRPLATGGRVDSSDGQTVRIRRLHLEEDAGKSLHDRVPGRTAIDLNRAGVPLVEIVTEPDLRSPAGARAFLVALKRRLEYAGISDCDMEKGSLRVDANVSARPAGSGGDAPPGARTELKNLNSFSNVERALAYEADRQARVLAGGGAVAHETLLWDADAGEARATRGKEAAADYRYFPEPDLPPLVLDADRVAALKDALPEPPDAREARFVADYGLPEYDAGVLTADRAVADYFEALADTAGDAKAASNWVMGEVMAWLNEADDDIAAFPIPAARLAGLVTLAAGGTVSSTGAKEVFERMLAGDDRAPADIVAAEGLARVADADRLAEWVEAALAEYPEEAERLRGGEEKLVGFFVGAVMRASGGTADPERVTEILRAR